ncbi:MAG: hypothetical protein E7546_05700 [Ruminococcaceae bacterium]|nr:hypothetical protein [Oscillospiraceae bacterium]
METSVTTGRRKLEPGEVRPSRTPVRAVIILMVLLAAIMLFAAVRTGVFEDESDVDFGSFPAAISSSDVSDSDPGEDYSIESAPEGALGTGVLYGASDIFSDSSLAAPVGTLDAGAVVYIMGGSSGVYHVISETGLEGYVSADLINTGGLSFMQDETAETTELAAEETEPVTTAATTKPTTARTSAAANAPSATTTKKPAEVVSPENFPVNSSPYFVYVEKGSHTITIYAKDENGKYTRPVRTYLTAVGRTSGLTPVGVFTLGGKEKWHKWGSKSYSPYATRYHGGLFIHGPIYTDKNFGTLKENSVSAIGTNASSGCMRTSASAAYFIYQFCPSGTYIKIVNGSPLGRGAGKPSIASQYIDPATGRIPVAGVSLSAAAVTLKPNESIQLKAVCAPANASEQACTWLSSNTAAARVDGNGLVTAVGYGTATISCRTVDGGFVAKCVITVAEPTTSTTTTTTTTTTEPTSASTQSTTEQTTSSTTSTDTTAESTKPSETTTTVAQPTESTAQETE